MGKPAIDADAEARFDDALRRGTDFFMGKGNVREAMARIARLLDEMQVPYAVVGGMALNEYGYERFTQDVDLLLTGEGLQQLKQRWLGRGYVEKFPGSRALRDVENGVDIDIVLTGEFPGDGKPKPVAFPDPAEARVGRTVRLLPLERLVELKLASGMTAPHRLRDLADVLELVRSCGLEEAFAERLDASVRDKFRELWTAAQTDRA